MTITVALSRFRNSLASWNSMRRAFANGLSLILLIGLWSSLGSAQTITTGDITGVVSDQTGAIIPNSKIVLKNVDNGQTRSMTAGSAGEFRFTTLQPGNYQLTGSYTGLKSSPTAITVSIGQVNNTTITLTPEATTTVLTVTEVAPLLNAENGNLRISPPLVMT
jgi:Carboxypeptidase regulatory-like domain